MSDLVGKIMDFEMGDLDAQGTLDLFAELVRTGMAWSLQGSYGRMAINLIENGWIDEEGNILRSLDEVEVD